MKNVIKKSTKMCIQVMLLCASVIFFYGCRVSDVREITINVHDADVNNPSCVSYMEKAIKTLPGSNHVKVEALPNKASILVTYDAMSVGRKNLEDALAQAGFNAGEYKANEKARSTLPSSLFLKNEAVKE